MIASARRKLSFFTILPMSQRSTFTAVGQCVDAYNGQTTSADSHISPRAKDAFPLVKFARSRKFSRLAKQQVHFCQSLPARQLSRSADQQLLKGQRACAERPLRTATADLPTGRRTHAEHTSRPAKAGLPFGQRTHAGHPLRHASECLPTGHVHRAWRHFKAWPRPARLRARTSLPCTILIGQPRPALSRQPWSADLSLLLAGHFSPSFRTNALCLSAKFRISP